VARQLGLSIGAASRYLASHRGAHRRLGSGGVNKSSSLGSAQRRRRNRVVAS